MSWLLAETEDEVNVAALDRWSFAHLSLGVAMGSTRIVPSWAVLPVLIGWELLEPKLEERYPGLFQNPNRESMRNAVADVLIGFVGYAIGRGLR